MSRHSRVDLPHAVRLVRSICRIAGDPQLIGRARLNLEQRGVIAAIEHRNNVPIFDWLMEVISLQGVSDAAALTYIRHHGTVRHAEVTRGLKSRRMCPKLVSFETFKDCRFQKAKKACALPERFAQCSLPRHDLRNGRLNQAAYSCYLFMRDVAEGDFVAWIDRQVASANDTQSPERGKALARSVIDPMRTIFGVSNKLLNMAMSDLLLAAGGWRKSWRDAGAAMVTIDTLVHNWLWRTGIMHGIGKPHAYGAACYGPRGCAELIDVFAERIDARQFSPTFPPVFPRFVEHAIWRFCGQSELNRCNGTTVDDHSRCRNRSCTLYSRCGRRTLFPVVPPT